MPSIPTPRLQVYRCPCLWLIRSWRRLPN